MALIPPGGLPERRYINPPTTPEEQAKMDGYAQMKRRMPTMPGMAAEKANPRAITKGKKKGILKQTIKDRIKFGSDKMKKMPYRPKTDGVPPMKTMPYRPGKDKPKKILL